MKKFYSEEKQQPQKNIRGGASSKLYGLLRIVSSGASTVARSAANVVAQSIADRNDSTGGTGESGHEQVLWAGFDKIEGDNNISRQVLLLGYQSGFQVWDIEEADNVSALVSRHDGPASFLQMLPKPVTSKEPGDKFSDSRPLLVVCGDGTLSGNNMHDGFDASSNGNMGNHWDKGTSRSSPTAVQFYSLASQSYVHILKFRSIIFSVRCSPRVVAICQASQIHCVDTLTLERDYTILTNPIPVGEPGSGGVGYGPLALGTRWLAYSGNPVQGSNHGRVAPQHLTTSSTFSSFPSNTNLVTHYAMESGKQLAAGIATLGDLGYKKLSRYCSELIPDPHTAANPALKTPDVDNVGMVVIRDIITKNVLAQFRAHKRPISALCFDPTGTLLVTASIQGNNLNVFKIFAGKSASGDADMSYIHLYRLQRGLTNAVIQDISFSDDSNWIMISSSRGTSHLFAINRYEDSGGVNCQSLSSRTGVPQGRFQPNSSSNIHTIVEPFTSGFPVTLSVVSRIRNGNNGWRGTVTGAAAAATGRHTSFSGAIASTFHNCKGTLESYADGISLKSIYHLLVFSPVGSLIQYSLRLQSGMDSASSDSIIESDFETDGRLVVEAVQKWNIYQKKTRREREDNTDIYGHNSPSEGIKDYNSPKSPYKLNKDGTCKPKIIHEEKHHLYIAEAELQMHPTLKPLWARQEIYFQYIDTERTTTNEDLPNGEFEIEKIPTRTIEARSKDLIPLGYQMESPKLQNSSLSKMYQSQKSDNPSEESESGIPFISKQSKASVNSRQSIYSEDPILDNHFQDGNGFN